MLGKDVSLRTRRALLLYKVFGDSTLLDLNGTSLNSISALLDLNWRYYFLPLFVESIIFIYKLIFFLIVFHLKNQVPWIIVLDSSEFAPSKAF